MEFFTFDWWWAGQHGGDEHPAAAFDRYRAHLDTIRDRLPADALRLEDELSIHDARLVSLDVATQARTLTLVLDGDDGHGGPRRFTLGYTGVRSFHSAQSDEPALSGPAGYGDLGYGEVHLAGDAFEHRFLFSTGIELRVVFGGLTLSLRDG
ncbi:hypothetical protein AY599_06675 [Leptolyngbya valderiana BDU 20041]|nr:hypothetical protein AY599_06675 [Leptolyngbya valderiana BDU 20041]